MLVKVMHAVNDVTLGAKEESGNGADSKLGVLLLLDLRRCTLHLNLNSNQLLIVAYITIILE